MKQSHTPLTMKPVVAVIGLGYVGLPLALLFYKRGFKVIGIDLNETKILKLSKGTSYIEDINDDEIREAVQSDRFQISSDYKTLIDANSIIICVPTPLNIFHAPDLSYLTQAVVEISKRMIEGQLIVLESSTYPGTTKEIIQPLLEKRGRKVGTHFHIGYSPERIDPGNKDYPIERIPKVISGITPNCLNRMKNLYGQVFDQVYPVSNTETAEFTKLLENAYRLINISFINELAMFCDSMNIDIWEVINAAKTKPFGFAGFYPGPGIGGHCIPIDPLYLQWKIKQYGGDSAFIRVSDQINQGMPHYVVNQLKHILSPKPLCEANILVYGAAYKPDVADLRKSVSLEIIKLLINLKANVHYHDPLLPTLELLGQQKHSIPLTADNLQKTDCVLIATNHSSIPLKLILENAPLVYDTRNVTQGMVGHAKVIKLGGGKS